MQTSFTFYDVDVIETISHLFQKHEYFLTHTFTLQDLYNTKEWNRIREKDARAFGKRFRAFIEKYPSFQIRLASIGRCAVYIIDQNK